MKQELVYGGSAVKGDLIEIYAKVIANLGPLNYLYAKSIDYDSPSLGPGMRGYHLEGTISPEFAYIARQLMDANDPVGECTMERSILPHYLFTGRVSRRITIENRGDDEISIEVEDSSPIGIARVQRLLDDMFKRNRRSDMARTH